MKGAGLSVEHVLIVDDDAELYQLVTRFLSREGFAASWAPNGAAGYLYASPAKPEAR